MTYQENSIQLLDPLLIESFEKLNSCIEWCQVNSVHQFAPQMTVGVDYDAAGQVVGCCPDSRKDKMQNLYVHYVLKIPSAAVSIRFTHGRITVRQRGLTMTVQRCTEAFLIYTCWVRKIGCNPALLPVPQDVRCWEVVEKAGKGKRDVRV